MDAQKGTKRQEQAQESRRRMLDTALALFALNGYRQTSVHAICRKMGVADGLLYHYFPGGKGELMNEIIRENIAQLIAELNVQNDSLSRLPVEEMLEALYQDIIRIAQRHMDVLRIFLQEAEIRELIANPALRDELKARQAWFPQLLAEYAARGEIRPIDYQSAAEFLDSVMLLDLTLSLVGYPQGRLSRPEHRRRLIAYQVGLWRGEAPSAGDTAQ